jgi:nucleoside-diphosphate-sugar epimerase
MERGKAGEVYNVGSGKSIRMGELLEDILKENGLDMNIVSIDNFDNRIDIEDIYADVGKASELGSETVGN